VTSPGPLPIRHLHAQFLQPQQQLQGARTWFEKLPGPAGVTAKPKGDRLVRRDHDQGRRRGASHQILSSQEYLRDFGYEHGFPTRNRVVGVARWAKPPSISPSRATTPYHRGVLGFPQVHLTQETVRSLPARAKQRLVAPRGLPAWVSQPAGPCARRGGLRNAGMDYLSKVPYRKHRRWTLIASLSSSSLASRRFIPPFFCVLAQPA